MKNNASAAFDDETPNSFAIVLAFAPIASTSSPAIPTRDLILVIDLSKSPAIFIAAPPAIANGNANRVCNDLPTACVLFPNDFNRPDAVLSVAFSLDASPKSVTLNSLFAIRRI